MNLELRIPDDVARLLSAGYADLPRLAVEALALQGYRFKRFTTECVQVNADADIHPDLIDSRFRYVSVSRASCEATVFTDEFAKLAPQLSEDISKTSALKIGQTVLMGYRLGIGVGQCHL